MNKDRGGDRANEEARAQNRRRDEESRKAAGELAPLGDFVKTLTKNSLAHRR